MYLTKQPDGTWPAGSDWYLTCLVPGTVRPDRRSDDGRTVRTDDGPTDGRTDRMDGRMDDRCPVRMTDGSVRTVGTVRRPDDDDGRTDGPDGRLVVSLDSSLVLV